jgi:hypothetical protein
MTDIPEDIMLAARDACLASVEQVIANDIGIRVIARAIMAERERCAKIAESYDLSIMSSTSADVTARKIAAAIRKGDSDD